MELSPSLFAQLTGVLEPSAPAVERLGIERRGSPRDRRRGIRLATSLSATLLRGDRGADPGYVGVEVFDISPRSVGLISPQRVAPGQQFVLRLPTLQGREITVGCVSIRQQLNSEGQYQIGAEFTHLLVGPSVAVSAGSV